jgi:hypothetical protein
MTRERILAILDNARSWPHEDQEELAEVAREIEACRTGVYVLDDEEEAAVEEALDQVQRGEFVSEEEMNAFWTDKLDVGAERQRCPAGKIRDARRS